MDYGLGDCFKYAKGTVGWKIASAHLGVPFISSLN